MTVAAVAQWHALRAGLVPLTTTARSLVVPFPLVVPQQNVGHAFHVPRRTAFIADISLYLHHNSNRRALAIPSISLPSDADWSVADSDRAGSTRPFERTAREARRMSALKGV